MVPSTAISLQFMPTRVLCSWNNRHSEIFSELLRELGFDLHQTYWIYISGATSSIQLGIGMRGGHRGQ